MKFSARLSSFVDNLRIAVLSAWRGRSRGTAVFAGVFLSSLVITTVLAYGSGLMTSFFEEGLEGEEYDYRVELWSNFGAEDRTDDPDLFESFCTQILSIEGMVDCTINAGRQSAHGASFIGRDQAKAQPLELTLIEGPDSEWEGVDIKFEDSTDNGPPTRGFRPIRFIGESGYDGVLLERHERRTIAGAWPTSEEAVTNRSIVIPAKLASSGAVEVGDIFSNLSFTYADADMSKCVGDDAIGEAVIFLEKDYCRVTITLNDLIVSAIYDDRQASSPLVSNQPIYIPWELLNRSEMSEIIDGDHVYLAVAADRGKLPTSSISDVETQLNEWVTEIEGKEYDGGNVEVRATDMDGSLLTFLGIILIFVQTFDYIIMVPIIILSVVVLIYGLVLSLEQRRREISIHRVMGGSSKTLSKMVLLEMGVISSVAWLIGYILALATVPLVLSAVGFMSFRFDDLSAPPTLSIASTFATAAITIGIAMIFGNSRTKDFINSEISEGVANVVVKKRPKYWLHWLTFLIGLVALSDSIMEDWSVFSSFKDGEGIVSNVIFDGLLAVFGPFFLWIGGALILARLGAFGPAMMRSIFGRTPLLKDIRRGLTGSGSADGIGRLALIIVLTLSIVTMSAVQGHTGTLVDEKTADQQVGADLKITFKTPVNQETAKTMVEDAWNNLSSVETSGFSLDLSAVSIPQFTAYPNGDDVNFIEVWVVSDEAVSLLLWDDQSMPTDSFSEALNSLQENGMMTHGESAQWTINLRDRNSLVMNQTNLSSRETTQMTLTTIGEHQWVPGIEADLADNVLFIGEATWRDWLGEDAPTDSEVTSQTWFFDLNKGESTKDSEAVKNIALAMSTNGAVSEVSDWKSSHENVEKNGGLVFGTPGLLSLQFTVSAVAAVASSFVFLSLVLSQRKKELSILQAIGASPNQVMRLVLFEILSITIVSMLLGGILGIGITYIFNDMFNIFGILFQAFGGSGVDIERQLIWPVSELLTVGLIVLSAVFVALFFTTRKAIGADLATVLKGE